MDIQGEKLDIIQWLSGIEDSRIIKQLLALKKSSEQVVTKKLTDQEKTAIDQGLNSINKGLTKSHEEVMRTTQEKYPHLFR